MKFTLSYVNDEETTTNYDKVFTDMEDIIIFVNVAHPKFTSYQVIVQR